MKKTRILFLLLAFLVIALSLSCFNNWVAENESSENIEEIFSHIFLANNSIESKLSSYGNSSIEEFFLNLKSKEEVIRIAITGDGHWGADYCVGERDDVNEIGYEKRHKKMIDWLNHEVSGEGLDFVVFNGDIVNNYGKDWVKAKEWYDKINVPYYVVHGNHDGDEDRILGFNDWEDLWGTPYDYDIEHKGVGFIFLGTGSEYREIGYSEIFWNYDFLKERSQFYIAENKPIFVITHISFDHPKYGGDYDGSYGKLAQKYHDHISSEPLIKAAIFSHNHRRRGVYNYDSQIYLYSGHFSYWPSIERTPMGYRIIEIRDGRFRSYWVNGETGESSHYYIENGY